MSELGFIFKPDLCIQCHACETACKNLRNLERGVKWRHVYNLWKDVYPQVSRTTLSVSCLHCTTPACVQVCPVNAISKRKEDGVVQVNRDLCVGCRKCQKACPVDAPQFGTDGLMQKCDLCTCGPLADHDNTSCVLVCPTGALSFRQMSEKEKCNLVKNVEEKLKK